MFGEPLILPGGDLVGRAGTIDLCSIMSYRIQCHVTLEPTYNNPLPPWGEVAMEAVRCSFPHPLAPSRTGRRTFRKGVISVTTVSPGRGRYRHYKGNFYEVVGIARHSETEEELVVYRKLYGDHSLWVRPLGMFMENVQVDGRSVPRFERIGENEGKVGFHTHMEI